MDDLPVSFASGCTARFAAEDRARKLLCHSDEFIERMSPFDRAVRLRSQSAVSANELLFFLETAAREWTPAERNKVCRALRAAGEQIGAHTRWLPPEIEIVKTSGEEEWHSAYTRGTALFLSQKKLAYPPENLTRLLIHELFHILSRANPGLRETLYAGIHFRPCEELPLPEDLASRRITNPDAPACMHSIRVTHQGKAYDVVPVTVSRVPAYDPDRGNDLSAYLDLCLLALEGCLGGQLAAKRHGQPLSFRLGEIQGFYEQVGRNTDAIHHPEEILASNFTLLAMGDLELPSPEIPARLREVFASYR